MAISKEDKTQFIKKFQLSERDTGSSQVQIALLTQRINDLTPHFKTHQKDHHGRRGLLRMVSRRRKLLTYLRSRNLEEYKKLIATLGLRR